MVQIKFYPRSDTGYFVLEDFDFDLLAVDIIFMISNIYNNNLDLLQGTLPYFFG